MQRGGLDVPCSSPTRGFSPASLVANHTSITQVKGEGGSGWNHGCSQNYVQGRSHGQGQGRLQGQYQAQWVKAGRCVGSRLCKPTLHERTSRPEVGQVEGARHGAMKLGCRPLELVGRVLLVRDGRW